MVTKRKIEAKTKLSNIDEISEHLGVEISTIMSWILYFGFPAKKIDTKETSSWVSSVQDIDDWLSIRGFKDPKLVSQSMLEEYDLKQKKAKGEFKKIRKTLTGINEIVKFTGFSHGTVSDWYRSYDPPIIRRDNELSADGEQLLSWMEELGFISIRQAFEKRELCGH